MMKTPLIGQQFQVNPSTNFRLKDYVHHHNSLQAHSPLIMIYTDDPMCKRRHHEVHLSEAFKHLLKYGEINSVGEPRWRFALHPRFPYWDLNMKQ